MHFLFNLLKINGDTAVVANQLTLYARNIPSAVYEAPPEDEQVMLEARRGQ
jgi:protein involved in temperature-dependent protein secretion